MTRCLIKENNIDEIIPGLFLGDQIAGTDKNILITNKIKVIIRVMPVEPTEHNKMYQGIKYIIIPIKDNETCQMDMNKLFDKTYIHICKYLNVKDKQNILIHCKRGHHRSAAVVGAFLMKHFDLNHSQVTKKINSIRPCALRKDKCVVKALARYYYYLNNIEHNGQLICNKVGKATICNIKPKKYKLVKARFS